MTRSTPARRRATRKTTLNPRTVLLAGIGAASLGRKQALKSIDGLAPMTLPAKPAPASPACATRPRPALPP